jgi:hypothetical protein
MHSTTWNIEYPGSLTSVLTRLHRPSKFIPFVLLRPATIKLPPLNIGDCSLLFFWLLQARSVVSMTAWWLFLAIHFKENDQGILECSKFYRFYLCWQRASMLAFLAVTQVLAIRQVCSLNQTRIPDCISMTGDLRSSETSRSPFYDSPYPSRSLSTKMSSEVPLGGTIKTNCIARR